MSDLTPLGLPAHLRSLVKPGRLPDRSKVSCLELDEVVVLGQYLGKFEEWTPTLRLAVGAWLTARRGEVATGEWTEFIAGYAEAVGRAPATVGTWMRSAQKAYELEPPKGAKADLRSDGPVSRAPRDTAKRTQDDADRAQPLPPDQATAMLQLDAAVTVAPARYVAKSAKPAILARLDRWCTEYLTARGVAVGNASGMTTNVTHSNDVSLRLPGDTKPAAKRRALAAVEAAESAPATCAHPPKGRYRGTSGVTMCKACGKVAR